MIYLTGDTHGGIDVNKLMNPDIQRKLTSEDFLIICGDFGFVWHYKRANRKEKSWLKWFEKQKWTTLFVDGNHECFPRLAQFEEKEWHGGRVHELRPNVLHLMRGEIYEIEGHTFFTMGGAASHDRGPAVGDTKAVQGKYWWPEEIPSEEERNHGIENLRSHGNRVDYIISHCLPTSLQHIVKGDAFKDDELTDYFEEIKNNYQYTHWYAGHYHVNRDLPGNVSVLFNRIVPLGDTVAASSPMKGVPIYRNGERVIFLHEGSAKNASVAGIYPWGKMRVKDQPVYDLLPDGEDVPVKYVKETDIVGYSSF